MKEYDLFIPLYYNDGTHVEPAKLQDLQRRLQCIQKLSVNHEQGGAAAPPRLLAAGHRRPTTDNIGMHREGCSTASRD